MRYLKPTVPAVLVVFTVLVCAAPIWAYLPGQCNPEHAKSDYDSAEAVAIGRVVKIERVREIERSKKRGDTIFFGYYATIKIGRAIRGSLKVGDEIMMHLGSYLQREENDATPTYAATHNTHPSYPLQFNGVYVLFVNRSRWSAESIERTDIRIASGELVPGPRALEILEGIRSGKVWEPRSCHFSFAEVYVELDKDDARKRTLCVRPAVPVYASVEPKEPVPLDEFLATKQKAAEEARKKREAGAAASGRDR